MPNRQHHNYCQRTVAACQLSTFLQAAFITLLLAAITACSGRHHHVFTEQERHRADSVAAATPGTDSLRTLAAQCAREGNVCGEIAAYSTLGKRYREKSMFTEAIDAHTKGLQCAVKACDTLLIVQALNNIGTNFRRMGILDRASSYHYQALAYCDACSDHTSRDMRKARVVSLNGIGNVHLTLDNREAADSVLRLALAGERALGSALGQAINCANIGSLFEADGRMDSARHYYRLSMQLNEEAQSELGISLCHTHFGRLDEKEGRLDSAAAEYRRAYDIMERGSDTWHWLEACLALARVYTEKGDMAVAHTYLEKAKRTAADVSSLEYLAEAYRLEYLWHRKRGDSSAALASYERSRQYADSIFNDKNVRHMQNVRLRYERDNKQNEIDLMQRNYQNERLARRATLVVFVVVLVLATVIIAFLWYVLRARSRKQQLLKEAEQMRTRFFTNVTHEFRTPLTVILSAAQDTLRLSPEGGDIHRNATDIMRHGQSLLDLINQMLDIAKMTAVGHRNLQWCRGDIVGFVMVLCESYRAYAAAKSITLVYAPREESVVMDFCPDYVLKIVQNLISNAIKFSRQGGRVTVSIKTDGGTLLLCIADEGIGMTGEQKANIFKPFYQASSGMGGMGTGIGLAVVKLAVESMNGRIEVSSEPDKGSEFVVALPMTAHAGAAPLPEVGAADKADAATALPDDKSTDDKSTDGTDDERDDERAADDAVRILIVEDTPEVARYISRQLNAAYSFYFATDGSEALRKAEELVPDIIVSDVMMPGMDGYELCRRVRASQLLCHVPLVMVTARATHADRIAGLEAGADAYLEKPFHADELSVRVEKLLEQRRMLRRKYSQAVEESGQAEDALTSDADRAFMAKVTATVQQTIVGGKTDYDALAYDLCLSRAQLNRKIKAITGYTTTEFILFTRIAMAKRLLDTADLTITELAMKCGMDNASYFCTLFKKSTGMTPMQYKNRRQ